MPFTKKIRKELIFDAILFLAGTAAICLFYENNILLTFLLMFVWFFGLKFWHKKHDVYFFITGAIIGPVGEIVAIRAGAWQYANPAFLGIPPWLPFAWGLATILILRFAEIFVNIEAAPKKRNRRSQ